ncbi:MAG: hypothetical protein M1818_008370 [Claussenomyces sp. TS43310]|nr:MAG: hypothetical protein M1818_008370 [Claussenomyces sp. TS43310]
MLGESHAVRLSPHENNKSELNTLVGNIEEQYNIKVKVKTMERTTSMEIDRSRLFKLTGLHALERQSSSSGVALSLQPSRHAVRTQTAVERHGVDQLQSFEEMRYAILYESIVREQLKRTWTTGSRNEGVFLRMKNCSYKTDPEMHHLHTDSILMEAIRCAGFQSALTIMSPMIQAITRGLRHDSSKVPHFLHADFRLQIIPSLVELHKVKRHHYAVIVLDPGVLLVWDSNVENLLERAVGLEQRILMVMWESPKTKLDSKPTDDFTSDLDEESSTDRPRRLAMNNSLMVALSFILMGAALGSSWKSLATEIAVDGNLRRLTILAYVPIQMFFGLFFMQLVVICLLELFGPTSQCFSNSRSFSGRSPRRLRPEDGPLPHVTIQIPVYTEGLAVVEPTIQSLKAAISTYEMQGGTANIFLNDDGLMLMDDETAARRIETYRMHDIGWVARPKHNPSPENKEHSFLRRGKFKKASNMNYGLEIVWNRYLDISYGLQAMKKRLMPTVLSLCWQKTGAELEQKGIFESETTSCLVGTSSPNTCFAQVTHHTVDSDTRVPGDCLLDAVSEMEESRHVAVLQFSSSTLQVTHDYFEINEQQNGISYFTKLIYSAIRFVVANGDIAPFVGHNAVLRWSALQAISYECDLDHVTKYWSECRVSEDFDLSLRLQSAGYSTRLAAYTGDGFKEGVSLTVYDEIARWEKYAYGAGELIFNPLQNWFTCGPLTSTFMDFMMSDIRLASKATTVAYFGTYFAIGGAWIMLLANYFIIGLFNGAIDHWYLDSYKIFFSLIVVFSLLSNISLAVLRYRLHERSLLQALCENARHILFLLLFFSGISLHLSRALLSYLLGIPMQWSTTAKEATDSNFFAEVPKLARFRGTFIFCLALTVMMIVMAWENGPVPWEWQITGKQGFIAVWPLAWMVACHAAVPVVLNPKLMLFKW